MSTKTLSEHESRFTEHVTALAASIAELKSSSDVQNSNKNDLLHFRDDAEDGRFLGELERMEAALASAEKERALLDAALHGAEAAKEAAATALRKQQDVSLNVYTSLPSLQI